MNVEKEMNCQFYFVRWDDVPVLVKFNDFVVYLPVFRSYEEALLASKDLKPQGKHGAYAIEQFSLEFFDKLNDHHRAQGLMLFMYPVQQKDLK